MFIMIPKIFNSIWHSNTTEARASDRETKKRTALQKMNAMLMGFSFPFTLFRKKIWIENHMVCVAWHINSQPCVPYVQLESRIPLRTVLNQAVWPRSYNFGMGMDWFLAYSSVKIGNDGLTDWQNGLLAQAAPKTKKTKQWRLAKMRTK